MNTEKLIAAILAANYARPLSHKVLALQKLDRWVKQVPGRISLALGIFALGLAMIGIVLSQGDLSRLGLVLELLGILLMGINPLVHEQMLASFRRRHAWDIVALAREIWQEETTA